MGSNVFDLERLRQNWIEPAQAPAVVEGGRFAEVALPVDPIVEGPAYLAEVRRGCERDFGPHMHLLEPFLAEVEAAGAALLAQRSAVLEAPAAEAAESLEDGAEAPIAEAGDTEAAEPVEAAGPAEAASSAGAPGEAEEAEEADAPAFDQDPALRLADALTSLEELLEVFMAARGR